MNLVCCAIVFEICPFTSRQNLSSRQLVLKTLALVSTKGVAVSTPNDSRTKQV